MLKIQNLHVQVEEKEILKGLSLEVNKGEIHVIMGPNGAGKSTLSGVLSGNSNYEVISGSISFEEKDLLEMLPEVRAREGIFLAFQYPIEVPGISNTDFMRASINEVRKYKGEEPLDPMDFLDVLKEKNKLLELSDEMLDRSFNEGFSGGEKKRNEILQMAVLEPKLAILDEIDSGLDVDALKTISHAINTLHGEDDAIILITHYTRILEYITPDFVHVMKDGAVVESGGKDLASKLEAEGYDKY